MSKPLILGEAPSRGLSCFSSKPLYGKTSRAILVMMGVDPGRDLDESWRKLSAVFELRNAVELYENAYPWTARVTQTARDEWSRYVAQHPHKAVVCLGRRAASVTPAAHLDWFEWLFEPPACYTVIPHPSGLNRLYNDSVVRSEAGKTLLMAVRSTRDESASDRSGEDNWSRDVQHRDR